MNKFFPIILFLFLIFVPFGLFLIGGWCIEPAHICSVTSAFDRSLGIFSERSFPLPILAGLIFFTSFGNPNNLILFCIVALVVLAIIRERFVATLFFTGLVLGTGLVFAGKDFFNRVRPPELIYSFSRIGASYPSGHAFISVVFYGFAGYVLWHHLHHRVTRIIITCVTLLFIIAIGFSRVALDFHWPSDVLGGWLLGLSVLTILIAGYRHVHRSIVL